MVRNADTGKGIRQREALGSEDGAADVDVEHIVECTRPQNGLRADERRIILGQSRYDTLSVGYLQLRQCVRAEHTGRQRQPLQSLIVHLCPILGPIGGKERLTSDRRHERDGEDGVVVVADAGTGAEQAHTERGPCIVGLDDDAHVAIALTRVGNLAAG